MGNLENAFSDYDDSIQKEGEILSGEIGIKLGGKKRTAVPNRGQFVYVRLRSNTSEVIQAFNDKVFPGYGVPVLLKWSGTRYEVIGRDVKRYQTWEEANPLGVKHGETHSMDRDGGRLGSDPAWIYSYQFIPALVSPFNISGVQNVYIHPYTLLVNGEWKQIGNTGTPSLTQYNPASGGRLVLITIDTVSGNPALFATTGTSIPLGTTGTSALLPYLPIIDTTQYIPLSFARLVNTTTQISWSNLYDARQFYAVDGGSSGVSGSFVESVTGDGVDNADPFNPILTFPTPAQIGAISTGTILPTSSYLYPDYITGTITYNLNSDQDDLNPAGLAQASVVRILPTGDRTISGLAGGYDGRRITLENISTGTDTFTLIPDGALNPSSPSNRFFSPTTISNKTYWTINAGISLSLHYDRTNSRWVPISPPMIVLGNSNPGDLAYLNYPYNYLSSAGPFDRNLANTTSASPHLNPPSPVSKWGYELTGSWNYITWQELGSNFLGTMRVQDEGVYVGSGTILNFVGDNVSASVSGTVIRIFVTGSATSITGIVAGGDLTGTYPNPSVKDDSHSHTFSTIPSSIVYDGDIAGGDLTGTYPNPAVMDDSHSHTTTTLPSIPVKATGAEIDTGTDDAKFVTAKAIHDSDTIVKLIESTHTATNISTSGQTTVFNVTMPVDFFGTGTSSGFIRYYVKCHLDMNANARLMTPRLIVGGTTITPTTPTTFAANTVYQVEYEGYVSRNAANVQDAVITQYRDTDDFGASARGSKYGTASNTDSGTIQIQFTLQLAGTVDSGFFTIVSVEAITDANLL